MGTNVFASCGDVWRRHRRVTSPAFDEMTYKNVWQATVQMYNSIMEKEHWATAESIVISNIERLCCKVNTSLHFKSLTYF